MEAPLSSTPSLNRLLEALEATWPPAQKETLGGWQLRWAAGGGSRVCSVAPFSAPDRPLSVAIDTAEAFASRQGGPSLFQIWSDQALDAMLAERGYEKFDPCLMLTASCPDITLLKTSDTFILDIQTPLSLLDTLWAEGGIGPERRAIMGRIKGPGSILAARFNNRLRGALFTACDQDIAFMHALYIHPNERRRGGARDLVIRAAQWAEKQGAQTIALAVRQKNTPAIALYRSLGFHSAGLYHYRRKVLEHPL